MPVKPQAEWASTYAEDLEQYYSDYQAALELGAPGPPIVEFWAGWVAKNADGIETTAPYPGSIAVVDQSSFAPVDFTGVASAVQAAQVLADAWQAFMNGLTWPPMTPAPPFTAITSVTTSALGLTAAYATLLAGLTAVFSTLPASPETAMQEKSEAIASLFYTATISVGVQIDGLGTGAPPPAVSIPQSPAL